MFRAHSAHHQEVKIVCFYVMPFPSETSSWPLYSMSPH